MVHLVTVIFSLHIANQCNLPVLITSLILSIPHLILLLITGPMNINIRYCMKQTSHVFSNGLNLRHWSGSSYLFCLPVPDTGAFHQHKEWQPLCDYGHVLFTCSDVHNITTQHGGDSLLSIFPVIPTEMWQQPSPSEWAAITFSSLTHYIIRNTLKQTKTMQNLQSIKHYTASYSQ